VAGLGHLRRLWNIAPWRFEGNEMHFHFKFAGHFDFTFNYILACSLNAKSKQNTENIAKLIVQN